MSMIFVVWGIEVGIKNRSKIEAQNELRLDIDFWWMLVDFGRQVGLEIEPRARNKMMKKICVLEAAGGGSGPDRRLPLRRSVIP